MTLRLILAVALVAPLAPFARGADVGAAISAASGAGAAPIELPTICAQQPAPPDVASTPVAELRARVDAIGESDPMSAVGILCATIPRVAREYGADSLELSWWVQTLATPLIAYRDEFTEAIPLLEFARPIIERDLGPDSARLADLHVAYGWIGFRRGRLTDAGDEWAAALRIREKVPGEKQIELQKALVGLAQVRLAQRNFDEARSLLERAQSILAANGEKLSEAAGAIENALTNVALREENYPLARRHAEAQLAIELQLRAANGPAQPVTAYLLYGQVLEKLDEYEQAEQAMREAVRLSEAPDGPLQRQHLRALTALGVLLNARGKPQEALPFAQRALAVATRRLGAQAPNLVGVLLSLAEIERVLGDLPASLAHYEQAGRIVAAHPADVERQVRVNYYRGLGLLQGLLGATADARTSLALGLDIAGHSPDMDTERAGVLLLLARLEAPGDPSHARTRLGAALALYAARLPSGHPTLLRVVNELCAIDVRTSPASAPNCTDAQRRLEAAREVDPALRHAVYANESALAEARRDADRAWALAVRALSAAATLGTPDPEWRAQYRVARLLHDRGDDSLAIFFGKQSIGRIEGLRSAFNETDRSLHGDFLHDKVGVYRAVADWLMEAGRMDEGLQVLDLLKDEELNDFVPRAGPPARAGVVLTDDERRLWTRYLGALRTDPQAGAEIDILARRREVERITPGERRRLDQLLAGQPGEEAARAQRIDAFIDSSSGRASPVGGRIISTERLARELARYGDDSAIGVYLLTDEHLRLIVATRKGQAEYRIDIDAATLRREIGELLDAISRREDVHARSRALYDTLMRPLADAAAAADAHRLILWPDDALRYIPFAALYDGGQYVIERFAIQLYAGAATDAGDGDDTGAGSHAATLATEHAAQPRALTVRGLGVTQAVAGYRALPAVADELCYIVRGPIAGLATPGKACDEPGSGLAMGHGALPGKGYANAAFTEARLDALLDTPRDFSILHLGTHFNLRPGNALRSWLLLGDGGHLTLDRIGALDFSGILLATLSGCQTGMGGAVTADGREVEGLSSIVQRRGAHSVIASLWRVEDRSTASLMRRMYDAMAAHTSSRGEIAQALRVAQLSLLDRHPYYWAGFLLTSQ
ncbi:MAG: CHAT domain-containing protein [Steroidobacteraceae bacterium]